MASTVATRGLLSRTAASAIRSGVFSARRTTPSASTLLESLQRRWLTSYPPHEVVGMPSLSPTMESGSIAKWNLAEGEAFAAGDILCEVETDKATVDFEAQDDGVIAKILADAGSGDIPCGEPIMVTVEDEGDAAAFKDYVAAASSSDPSPPAAASPEPVATPEPAPSAAPGPAVAAPSPAAAAAPPTAAPGGRVVASPLAFTVAKEMGHDLSAIHIVGTGPGGRIIAADVKEYVPTAATAVAAPEAVAAAAPAPAAAIAAPAAPPVLGAGYTDYPLSPAALDLANRLSQSKRNVPHYYLTVDIALDSMLELRSTLNASLNLAEDEPGISVNDLLVKAAAAAMKAVPSANASWMESAVRVYDSVDVNVVVGNGDALFAPVVRNVGGRGVKGISDDINAAIGQISDEEGGDAVPVGEEFHAMGTFTVMNVGMYGAKSCAPIIREPQACALALGAIENRIVPNEDEDSEEIYKQSVMLTATLSCDHRVVDGAVGAQWLSAFKSHVENPATLLL